MTTDVSLVQRDMRGNTVKGKTCDNDFLWQVQVLNLCLKQVAWLLYTYKQPSSFTSSFQTRCATGYHGNPQTPGGRCEECKCSLWGAWPEPCDPVTGQCHCRVGATGQSCDQCMERHVCGPTGIICKTNSQLLAAFFLSYLFHFGLWLEIRPKLQGFLFF